MLDRLRIFLALLGLVFVAGTSTFNNNIDMNTGLVIPPPGLAPAAPVVTANQTRTLTTGTPPVNNGDNIGAVLTASGTPTDWAITSCPGCAGYFDFLPNGAQHTGQLRVANAAALNAITTATNYQPIVQASNTGGQGSATVTITATPGAVAGTKPVISTTVTTFSPSTPATNGFQFATLTATNVPTQWVITNVSGALGTDFQINTDTNAAHDGKLVWGSTGATGFNGSVLKKTASLTIRADNAGGQSSTVVFTVNAYADGSIESCVDAAPNPPPVVQASTFNVFDPVANGTTVGDVIATNPPNTYSVLSCPNCTGFFNFPTATSPTMKVTAAGATALNALAVQTTYHPVVQASNGGGNGSNTMDVVVSPASAFDDGHLNASICSTGPNNPTFFAGYVARPPWQVAGVDYCVGVPDNITLTDPLTLPLGADIGAGTCTGGNKVCRTDPNNPSKGIVITGDGGTLNGYNFGPLNGDDGWTVFLSGAATNATITNNSFKISPVGNHWDMLAGVSGQISGSVTIRHNTFDYNFQHTGGNNQLNFSPGNGGTATFEYNVVKNAWGDFMEVGGDGAFLIRYNYFSQAGTDPINSHADWVGTPGAAHITSERFDFNTVEQTLTTAGSQGVGYGCGIANHVDIIITDFATGDNNSIKNGQGTTSFLEPASIPGHFNNNYVDYTHAGSGFHGWFNVLDPAPAQGCTHTPTHSGNILMTTGGPANPN